MPTLPPRAVDSIMGAQADHASFSGAPAHWRAARYVRTPARFDWLRQVTAVVGPVTGIRDFIGSYVNLRGTDVQQAFVHEGSVLLGCVPQVDTGMLDTTRRANYRRANVMIYIFLPENIWYSPTNGTHAQRTGWHADIATELRSWTILTRVERVQRACREAIALLIRDAAIHADEATNAAYLQFQQILASLEEQLGPAGAPNLNLVIGQQLFIWLQDMAATLEIEPTRIRAIAYDLLARGADLTEGSDALSEPETVAENRQTRKVRLTERVDGNQVCSVHDGQD
jgi:hypothetical protein